MTSMTQLATWMQQVLGETANAAADGSGFHKRDSPLTGALFVQTLVLGWLDNPEATLEDLAQTTRALGGTISASGLFQRLGPAGAACLRAVLAAALGELISSEPVVLPVLERFPAVTVQDSTTIGLPAALASLWPGCGGSTPTAGAAVLKVQVRFDLRRGSLDVLALEPGRQRDQTSPAQQAALPEGSLKLADLGYCALANLVAWQAQGVLVLCRLKSQTTLWTEAGERQPLASVLQAQAGALVDQPVRLGVTATVAGRLVAQRVPEDVAAERRRKLRAEAKREGRVPGAERLALCAWTVYFTTVPRDRLSLAEALVVYRLRWQVELLFKLWKQAGKLDQSRGRTPWRLLCEVYAKLLGLLVQHWLLLLTCWRHPDKSLVKAARTIRRFATALATAFADRSALLQVLTTLARCLAQGARLSARASRRPAYQLLQALAADWDTPEGDVA